MLVSLGQGVQWLLEVVAKLGARVCGGIPRNLLILRCLCDCPAWRGRQDKCVSGCGAMVWLERFCSEVSLISRRDCLDAEFWSDFFASWNGIGLYECFCVSTQSFGQISLRRDRGRRLVSWRWGDGDYGYLGHLAPDPCHIVGLRRCRGWGE